MFSRRFFAPIMMFAALMLFATSAIPGGVTTSVVAPASAQTGTCAPVPKATVLKVAIMGDSITTSYGASTPSKSWPERLKAQGATHGWQVTLHGQGGTMASQYLPSGDKFWVTEQVRSAQPGIVAMDFRANEHLNGQSPALLKTNMLALIDTIRQVSPGTQFLIINPPVLWYHGFYTTVATQADYAAKMFEVAQERNGCWLDMTPFFSQTAKDPDLPDDIHPNDEGHAKFFVAGYSTLLQHCS